MISMERLSALDDCKSSEAITACPKCVAEDGQRMDVLTFERDGVVSCRHHGEMTIAEVMALINDQDGNIVSVRRV